MISLTIFVDADKYQTAKELHLALKMLLDLPEYYGCNADALHDCLTERKERPRIVVMSRGATEETASAMSKCLRVFEDCDCQIICK